MRVICLLVVSSRANLHLIGFVLCLQTAETAPLEFSDKFEVLSNVSEDKDVRDSKENYPDQQGVFKIEKNRISATTPLNQKFVLTCLTSEKVPLVFSKVSKSNENSQQWIFKLAAPKEGPVASDIGMVKTVLSVEEDEATRVKMEMATVLYRLVPRCFQKDNKCLDSKVGLIDRTMSVVPFKASKDKDPEPADNRSLFFSVVMSKSWKKGSSSSCTLRDAKGQFVFRHDAQVKTEDMLSGNKESPQRVVIQPIGNGYFHITSTKSSNTEWSSASLFSPSDDAKVSPVDTPNGTAKKYLAVDITVKVR
jgi:hypothetical protein